MKRILVVFTAVAVFALFMPGAALAGNGTVSKWLKGISYKLKLNSGNDSASSSKNAVAGAKGAEGENKEELYWKSVVIKDEERAAFNEALKLIDDGKNPEAAAKLEAFVEKYPDSPLVKDAKEGIAALKQK
ncbi:MAG: hypothetical protein OEV59_00140 [Deltaproteobacteria bacterium]|nr:hypothetical protein [Deltaproteobacteria bacterium]